MTHPSLPQPQHCPPTFDAYLISDSHKTTFLSYSCIQISRLSDIFFVLNVLTSRFSPITHGSMLSIRMGAEWRKFQNRNRVDRLASCKMTHNFGAVVTFLLKFHHCVEAIFLIFRVLGNFYTSLQKVLHSVSNSKRWHNSHVVCNCSPWGCVGYPRPYKQGLNTFKRQKKRRSKFVIGAYIWSLTSYWKTLFKAISGCIHLRGWRDFYPVNLFISIIWLQLAVFAEPHQSLVAFLNSFILKV